MLVHTSSPALFFKCNCAHIGSGGGGGGGTSPVVKPKIVKPV